MNKTFILSCYLLCSINANAQYDSSKFKMKYSESDSFDFGIIDYISYVQHTFEFKNLDTVPIIIQNIQSVNNIYPYPEWPKEPIPPGQTGKITLTYHNIYENRGPFLEIYTIKTNIPARNGIYDLFLTGDLEDIKPVVKKDGSDTISKTVTTHISAFNESGIDLNVYPNPANNAINISVNLLQPEPFDIYVYDMSGREIDNYHENVMVKYTKTIPINNLANGNYFIKIITDNGYAVKQLVIKH